MNVVCYYKIYQFQNNFKNSCLVNFLLILTASLQIGQNSSFSTIGQYKPHGIYGNTSTPSNFLFLKTQFKIFY